MARFVPSESRGISATIAGFRHCKLRSNVFCLPFDRSREGVQVLLGIEGAVGYVQASGILSFRVFTV